MWAPPRRITWGSRTVCRWSTARSTISLGMALTSAMRARFSCSDVLSFIDPIFEIGPKEEVERTQVWRVRRPLNLFLQADDPAREALLEPETRCSSGMRSCAILLEPLLLDIGTDGLELLPEGLQATARTDRSSQTDRSACRIDSTERALRGLPLPCFLWNSLPSLNFLHPSADGGVVRCQARLHVVPAQFLDG